MFKIHFVKGEILYVLKMISISFAIWFLPLMLLIDLRIHNNLNKLLYVILIVVIFSLSSVYFKKHLDKYEKLYCNVGK